MNDALDKSGKGEPEAEAEKGLPVELEKEAVDESVETLGEAESRSRHVTMNVGSLAVGLGVVLLAAALGVAGFLVGKGTGEDLDMAREEGQVAGREAGAARGAKQGFKVGFRQGKAKGYDEAYEPAYRHSYSMAYEDAGLDPPRNKEIEVPRP